MSCLVHPLGWRLYTSKYWRANFFVSREKYLLAFFATKLLVRAILSILNRYHLRTWRRNVLKFSTFKTFFMPGRVLILVRYKFYWKNIYRSLRFFNLEKLTLRAGTNYANYAVSTKSPLGSVLRSGLLSIRKRFQFRPPIVIFNSNAKARIMGGSLPRLVRFFYLVPHLIFLKKLLRLVARRTIPTATTTKIFFVGLNHKSFNLSDALDFAEAALRRRSTPNYVFYKLVRIFKSYMNTQRISGYKILLTGRFSRRDRATFLWRTFGRVSLGSRLADVVFLARPIILPYSKCSVKIWVCQS